MGDKGEKEKFKLVDESQQNVGFWDLMEKAAKEILSPEETEKFLAAVRKVILCILSLRIFLKFLLLIEL